MWRSIFLLALAGLLLGAPAGEPPSTAKRLSRPTGSQRPGRCGPVHWLRRAVGAEPGLAFRLSSWGIPSETAAPGLHNKPGADRAAASAGK